MRLVTLGSLAVVASMAMSSASSAAVVFSDDFEGSGYNNGDNVAIHTPDVGLQWSASSNSLLRNASPAPAGSGGTYYASLNDRIIGQLNAGDIAATTSTTVYTEFDFYVTSDSGYGLNYITFAPSPGYRGPDFILQPDGTMKYYTNASNTYNPVANFSFTVDAWQHASIVVNYGTGAGSITVGAQTGNFTVADPLSTSIREIYFINTNNNQNLVGVDNIVVSTTPVPEPVGLSVVGLGVIGLLHRRRKA